MGISPPLLGATGSHFSHVLLKNVKWSSQNAQDKQASKQIKKALPQILCIQCNSYLNIGNHYILLKWCDICLKETMQTVLVLNE